MLMRRMIESWVLLRAQQRRTGAFAHGTPLGIALALALVLSAPGTSKADLLPSTGFRQLGVQANGGVVQSLTDTGLDPLDQAFSDTATSPGLICPVLTWTADAEQTSSITSSAVQAFGSTTISTPPAGCIQGSNTLAWSSASFRFTTDETHEFVLTGTSLNTHVRLAEFNGSLGPIYFERLPTDPGGPLSLSITLPPGGYSFLVDANADQAGSISSADFDVQLDALPVAAPVPGLGIETALLLGAGLVATGVMAVRRARQTPARPNES
jgi:hypothetical protein